MDLGLKGTTASYWELTAGVANAADINFAGLCACPLAGRETSR